jgi:hypothetical protein
MFKYFRKVGLHGVKKSDSRPASIKGSSSMQTSRTFPDSHLNFCYEKLHLIFATVSILLVLDEMKVSFKIFCFPIP